MLIQQFQAPEDAPARAPGPTVPSVTPDAPRTVADAPATGTVTPTPPPQTNAELPTPAVQATPLPRQPSFLAFFIQHLRSDPQMRLCASLPVLPIRR